MIRRALAIAAIGLGFLCSLWVDSAIAETQLIELRGVGSGPTENEAITDALNNAVSQHNGADVSTDTRTSSATAQGVVHDNSSGANQSFSASIKQSSSSSFKTAGQVADYKILSRSTDVMGLVHVTVLAHVASYVAPGDSDKRLRLAILPVRSLNEHYSFYGDQTASELSQLLTTALESEVVQTRRFSVLDRRTLTDSFQELQLVGSDLTSPTEKAKLGKIKGADFLLVSTIKSASYSVQERTAATTGQVFRTSYADLSLEVRVIVPATGEVKFSETYDVQEPTGRQAMVDAIAHMASGDLVSRIYPLQVIAVPSPGILVINQGGRSIHAGEQFLILQLGSSLKDPYSGESLGATETPIGSATVDRIDGKVAYLRLVQGDPSQMKAGLLARLDLTAAQRVRDQQPPPSVALPAGPVKLPFDR